MTELRTWPETLDYIAANGDFEDDEDAEIYRDMARDWRALEAENARLQKVYEAALRINGWDTDSRSFEALQDAILEARDAT